MSTSLTGIESRMRSLDERLRDLAKRPVDLDDPSWYEKLGTRPHPLDEAGIREQAEAVALELIDAYQGADAGGREILRCWYRRYDAFAWASTAPTDRASASGLRAHLLWFSIADQGADPRDAMLWLRDLCAAGRESRLDVSSLCREVAALSSEEDRFGWGSTQEWLSKVT